jgi:hypothetical protein
MKKIEIFDPAMCCPTGVCGPSIDPELARIANALFLLEKKGVEVRRYNLGNEPDAFIANEWIKKLLDEKGMNALPATVVDGKVMKDGIYPTTTELSSWTGVSEKELIVEKPSAKRISLDLKPLK